MFDKDTQDRFMPSTTRRLAHHVKVRYLQMPAPFVTNIIRPHSTHQNQIVLTSSNRLEESHLIIEHLFRPILLYLTSTTDVTPSPKTTQLIGSVRLFPMDDNSGGRQSNGSAANLDETLQETNTEDIARQVGIIDSRLTDLFAVDIEWADLLVPDEEVPGPHAMWVEREAYRIMALIANLSPYSESDTSIHFDIRAKIRDAW